MKYIHNMSKKIFRFAIVVTVFVAYAAGNYALAQDTDIIGDFMVSPGKVELMLSPGESRTVELVITNRTGEMRDFFFAVEDVAGTSEGDRPVVLLGSDRSPYTLKDYLAVPSGTIPLAHGEAVRVPITVSVPVDAEPGGRYGSVLVNTAARGSTASNVSSPVVARIGTLFFVTVEGEAASSGELKQLTTVPSKRVFHGDPVTFALSFENTGSVHLNPYGEIRVTDTFGRAVAFIALEPWYALPQSLRVREVTWEPGFAFGRYTATAHINRGYDDIVDTKEFIFWIIPWPAVLVVAVGIALLVLTLMIVLRSRKKSYVS
jgi:hypothetical protein